MEAYAPAQLERVDLAVRRDRPALRQGGRRLQRRIELDEGIEELADDGRRGEVGRLSGIEGGRVGVEGHAERAAVPGGACRAARRALGLAPLTGLGNDDRCGRDDEHDEKRRERPRYRDALAESRERPSSRWKPVG